MNDMRYKYQNLTNDKQTGAALVTGLIFMVVLTIIVISALRSATLEERMAANARNRQLALQAAEAVVREAEVALVAGAPFDPFTPSSFTAGCTNGYCNKAAVGTTPRWKTVAWDTVGRTGTLTINGVSAPPRYIVEIANVPVFGGAGGICPKILYRITARGVGQDNSTVFVQTMFRHLPASC
jgi:type IV pilus assembly protein PilX